MEIGEVVKLMVRFGDAETQDMGKIVTANLAMGKEVVKYQMTCGDTSHWIINWAEGCDMPIFIWFTASGYVKDTSLREVNEIRWWDPELNRSGLLAIR